MKTTSKIIAGVAVTLSLAVAGAVFAQPGYGPGFGGMGYGGMGHGHMGYGGMGYGMGPGGPGGYGMGPGGYDMAAAAAGYTAEMKVQLKITPEQEKAWKTYEDVVKQQAGAMQAMRDQFHAQWQDTKPGATAPDMAAQHQAMFALRQANQTAQSAALKDLYAVLTPEQKAIADRSLNFMGAQRGPGRYPGR
jgi:Spy/CpxP family protein refolding chaperone